MLEDKAFGVSLVLLAVASEGCKVVGVMIITSRVIMTTTGLMS